MNAKKAAILHSTGYTSTISSTALPQNPTLILKVLLNGTFFVVTLLFLLLLVSYFIRGNTYVLWRIEACIVVLVYLLGIRYYIEKKRTTVASLLLIGFYTVLAALMLSLWSINDSIGILILGFVVVLAGVTLGARYILFAAFGVIALMAFLQLAVTLGITHPDISSFKIPAGFGDVIGYATIFVIISLVSWLSRRQMEHALFQARAAETALEHERDQLEVRLEERTRKLQEVQLQEMQQLYRFAELGQLSTLLLHELANHLTVLTLDMEDIQERHTGSKAIIHAQESIGYLEAMVAQTRLQLQDRNEPVQFSIVTVLKKTIKELRTKARKAHVLIELEHSDAADVLEVTGDPIRLGQILSIIITNAIEASASFRKKVDNARVEVLVRRHEDTIEIHVSDWGAGISEADRKRLFEPFQSTKKDGMGIGLFIAKQTIEMHFKGTIRLKANAPNTVFIVTLPFEGPK